MVDFSEHLFDRPGYIPIKEYMRDINGMRKDGPWRIPLGIGDRLQLFFLNRVIRFSWFADALHIMHNSIVSPVYATLLSYAQKRQFFDSMAGRSLPYQGYFSYYLEKKVLINDRTWIMSGQGVAKDKATALSIALGEMIERVISGLYDMNKNIVVISPDELMKKHLILYPPRYHRFLDVQKKKFKELRHDSTKPIPWVIGENLIIKEKTYIPKNLTSWFNKNSNEGETLIQPTSNGCAGYFTKTGAVLRGLLETVQRDAFLVHWLTMIPPRSIMRETLPEEIQEKIQEFEAFGISLHVLDITSIPIPSVCIVAVNTHSEVPQIVVSAASSVVFEEAIQNALKEMSVISEMFYRKDNDLELRYKDIKPEPFISDLGKIDRQLYWRGVDRVEQFQWFISGNRISYDHVCKQNIHCDTDDFSRLEKCLGVLKKLGEDYYPIVYYPKNKAQGELGFFVAQVYIPKAFSLYLYEGYGTFDSDRLQEFASSKGASDWKLNSLPHMFS